MGGIPAFAIFVILDICHFRLCCYRHPPSFTIIGAHNPEELCHKRNVAHDEGGGSYLFLLLLLAMLALACFNIWRKVRRKTRNQY